MDNEKSINIDALMTFSSFITHLSSASVATDEIVEILESSYDDVEAFFVSEEEFKKLVNRIRRLSEVSENIAQDLRQRIEAHIED